MTEIEKLQKEVKALKRQNNEIKKKLERCFIDIEGERISRKEVRVMLTRYDKGKQGFTMTLGGLF